MSSAQSFFVFLFPTVYDNYYVLLLRSTCSASVSVSVSLFRHSLCDALCSWCNKSCVRSFVNTNVEITPTHLKKKSIGNSLFVIINGYIHEQISNGYRRTNKKYPLNQAHMIIIAWVLIKMILVILVFFFFSFVRSCLLHEGGSALQVLQTAVEGG